MGTATGLGRVRHITSAGDSAIVTVDGADGPRDLVVAVAPDPVAATSAAAGLWRLQWVRLHLDAEVPFARLAGTTRHPHVRAVPVAAALALAQRGVPAYVVGEGA